MTEWQEVVSWEKDTKTWDKDNTEWMKGQWGRHMRRALIKGKSWPVFFVKTRSESSLLSSCFLQLSSRTLNILSSIDAILTASDSTLSVPENWEEGVFDNSYSELIASSLLL
jgi:hypothetical protein